MVLDTAINKNSQSFNFLGHAASAVFSSRKPRKNKIEKTIEDGEEIISFLVDTLETLDKTGKDFDEELIEKLLNSYTLGLNMSRPLVTSLENLITENGASNSKLYSQYNALYQQAKEVTEILDKIIFKLQTLKESIISSEMLAGSLHSSDDFWSKEEQEELNALFLEA